MNAMRIETCSFHSSLSPVRRGRGLGRGVGGTRMSGGARLLAPLAPPPSPLPRKRGGGARRLLPQIRVERNRLPRRRRDRGGAFAVPHVRDIAAAGRGTDRRAR